jgi:hypothetical protein
LPFANYRAPVLKRPDVAQRLREALRDGGTDRQKRYLELTLEK